MTVRAVYIHNALEKGAQTTRPYDTEDIEPLMVLISTSRPIRSISWCYPHYTFRHLSAKGAALWYTSGQGSSEP